jgi:hypothetical protein
MRSRILAFSTVLLFVLSAALLGAQEAASVTGTVTDVSGAALAGATVTLQDTLTGVTSTTTTNAEGSYTFNQVKPGPGYRIEFSANGFKPTVITGIYMNVDATRTQDAKLAVGTATQTVEVSASNQDVTLDTTDVTVGNNFQVQFLQDLPVQNRDSPAALFTQQPGVTLSGAVTGARTDQNNVTLDGLDENDMATGQFEAIVGNAPVDSVQEFRAVTAGELSSSGEGGGGQFELVTKSGTNQFHGDANWYHRDTDTEANDWFNNDAGIPRSPLIRNYFGGAAGGPIKRNKAFFFFDFDGRRDTLSNLVRRTVPGPALRGGGMNYVNTAGATVPLTAQQMAAFDPSGIGYDQALLKVVSGRYPAPNDFTRGDKINTAGFDFNAPYPLSEQNYVARIDYNLTDTQKLWGKVSFAHENATQSAIQYLGDPETFPFLDKSHTWAVGHTWTIGANKTNQAEYGEVYENYSFPNTYNPTGVNYFYFGGIPSGGEFLSAPYASPINAQSRTYPIPVIRDDFSWLKGKHDFQIGGTFKYISPDSDTILDYNTPTVGLGAHLTGLCGPVSATNPTPCGAANGTFSMRPSDIATSDDNEYDQVLTFALGHFQSVGATYNYNAQGNAVPQGTGSVEDFRYYETELYFGDTWKITPRMTISYGVRWQNYSVPYEIHGIESLPNIGFTDYFDARIAQSKAGAMGAETDCNSSPGVGVPCVNYILGGKANNAPGYFSPQWDNFAPRLAITWSPSADGKSVLRAGAGVVYDHTVVSAVQYQATQYSYLFQSSANTPFGTTGDPVGSLTNDARFGGFTNPPPPPTAPAAIKPPFTPFVSDGSPYGLANGQAFNEGVDKNLRTPYSIQLDAGFQHEFPMGFILKLDYAGRLGRRLLGQVDANQLIDFPDTASGQLMSAAFAGMETSWRKQVAAGTDDPTKVTPQPWFEDLIELPTGFAAAHGYGSNTGLIAYALDPYTSRGDFADTVEALSSNGLIADNVGMGSQFSEFTYYTNKGFSSYNGMLVTLHKNFGQGLQFDLNYTWSHSIDNVSVVANAPAIGGYGFICDALRPRSCRGNSDFDATNYISGNFIYNLPFGRGRSFAATAPIWLNEIIGGWDLGGLPVYHTGVAYFAYSNAFVAGYANDAPAVLTGQIGDMKARPNKDATGTLWIYAKQNNVVSDYSGPTGFNIGSRNNLRGPGYFDLDLGLGKTFPIYEQRLNLKFRCDAFNALNHPSFDNPSMSNADITQSSALFGQLTSMNGGARVLQGALRLEF